MKPTFKEKSAKFQQGSEKTSRNFNERSFNERDHKGSDRRAKPQGKFAKDSAKQTAYSYPLEGRKASGEGKVKILVKGGNPWQGEKEKKTGPLSPRAPEKIKKNRAEEMKVYGENACLTLFQQRPQAIVRLWATVEGAKKLGEVTSCR